MEDDHVDRPGVEERQRLKLTGTNSSIGLIVLIPYAHRETRWSDQRSRMSGPYGPMLREGAGNRRRAVALAGLRACARKPQTSPWHRKQLLEQRAFCRPGGYGGAAAPDPIPNSAVKRSSADGTSSQDAGE